MGHPVIKQESRSFGGPPILGHYPIGLNGLCLGGPTKDQQTGSTMPGPGTGGDVVQFAGRAGCGGSSGGGDIGGGKFLCFPRFGW